LPRDAHLVEEQLRGVLRLHADLLEPPAALEAGHAPLDGQQGEAAAARLGVGARDDDDEVGVDAVGDERLRARHDPVVAVAAGGRAQALQVGPGAGSVIAIAVIISPLVNRGSQRSFCSSVVSSSRYGAMTSLCSVKPTPLAPTRTSSSLTTQL
jgi:hypothetical protein